MSSWTPQDFAEAIAGFRREMYGLARRMVIGVVPKSIWQLVGHYADYANQGLRETRDVEMFPGIGHFARPPNNSTSAEAIMIQVGGPNGAVGVATRDEATRTKVDDIKNDESTLYNSLARVYVKADGTVEIRTHGGVAIRLPTLADVQGLATYLQNQFDASVGHTHTVVGGATTAIAEGAGGGTAGTAPNPVGTTVFKTM